MSSSSPLPKNDVVATRHLLCELVASVVTFARSSEALIAEVPERYRDCAQNLLHYLALRQHDLRDLQRNLATFGLSSLGRCESHVLTSLLAVLRALDGLTSEPPSALRDVHPPIDFADALQSLEQHTEQLLGPRAPDRPARIMVTMSTAAATDYVLIRNLVATGMDVMRINCAHDDRDVWQGMIAQLRRAEREVGRKCRILVDIAGPKLRTGSIWPRASVLKLKPARDNLGRVIAPARVWLTPTEAPQLQPGQSAITLTVDGELLRFSRPGDRLRWTDTRGKRRSCPIVAAVDDSRCGELRNTAYVRVGDTVELRRNGRTVKEGRFGPLLGAEESVRLKQGDRLWVVPEEANDDMPGSHDGATHVTCQERSVFGQVCAGERVYFDDGKIGGVIRQVTPAGFEVEIARTSPGGDKLGVDKGINLPDSKLTFSTISDKDLADLDFVAREADIVGLSFVQNPDDLGRLKAELARRSDRKIGVILKIETRSAFENLPRLLLAALQHMPAGVMIARGDLGVELGLERLAEVQEEVLWLAEAAHLPAIWATQVLESMAKTGRPSRAEVTDAAMSVRAECVMLNKGPYIVETVRFLSNVLRRMQAHHQKKDSMLRQLSISGSPIHD
jgi:pyruvate kinase